MKANYTEDDYGPNYKNHILEQYKLYVEMADRISQRRVTTNTFFISINTFLITITTFFRDNSYLILCLVSLIGFILALVWYDLVNSYKRLNTGKYRVIHELEELLPVAPYKEEWNKLGCGKNKKLYYPVSYLEATLPAMVSILYVILLIYAMVENCL